MKPLISELQQRVEARLQDWLPAASIHPQMLHEAMRYSVLNGGKRIRPILTYGTGMALGVPLEQLDGPACAMELIHVYSLVHDDLPAMDDDDLRRGKPTCHKAFDEATAILVGDALQALAFQILAQDRSMLAAAEPRLAMIQHLAMASGSRGMVGGQAIDLASAGKTVSIAELEDMHVHKTGALIRAAVMLATLGAPSANEDDTAKLDHYAKCIGLAFQIQDDVLDVIGDTHTLGKTQGADQALGKATYPALMGLEASKKEALELVNQALSSIERFGEKAELLRYIARYIIERIH
ncbi:farnesyl-diphosphate synthase [Ectothiorhodosinus mongolicus]|uniref:Farnesyl-diphosphate synthase n=1 Tax=Ectothiorhodosinus mongolicus TaxID=233100 RepID=A0A1R3W087_9GAMM|nr:farnesyl diphosphate synthase [Ectothiorhodosinus mongolicus]ULX57328.1 (2E,6E)-farnesyl diphosphate synthase [Ectothiorhodosinus mongolicus]SIT70993.1 farnesyl-diphosphate synthase [Ectothiorhodosinus mongolicus]